MQYESFQIVAAVTTKRPGHVRMTALLYKTLNTAGFKVKSRNRSWRVEAWFWTPTRKQKKKKRTMQERRLTHGRKVNKHFTSILFNITLTYFRRRLR